MSETCVVCFRDDGIHESPYRLTRDWFHSLRSEQRRMADQWQHYARAGALDVAKEFSEMMNRPEYRREK